MSSLTESSGPVVGTQWSSARSTGSLFCLQYWWHVMSRRISFLKSTAVVWHINSQPRYFMMVVNALSSPDRDRKGDKFWRQ